MIKNFINDKTCSDEFHVEFKEMNMFFEQVDVCIYLIWIYISFNKSSRKFNVT